MLETNLFLKKKKGRGLPIPLSNFAATLGAGYLHVHGGIDSSGPNVNTYYYMNLATWEWGIGAANVPQYKYPDGFYVQISASDRRFYCEGGLTNSISAESLYNVIASKGVSYYSTGDTPDSRARIKKRMKILSDNNTVYMVGGENNTGVIAHVIRYTFSPNRFTVLAPLPVGLVGHEIDWYNGKLYCMGGKTKAGIEQSAVYEYDPTANTWTKITDLPTPVAYHGGCIYKNLLVMGLAAVPGQNFSVGIFNLDTKTWVVKETGLPSRYGCRYLADVTVNKGIMVLGGINGNSVDGAGWMTNPRYDDIKIFTEEWLNT